MGVRGVAVIGIVGSVATGALLAIVGSSGAEAVAFGLAAFSVCVVVSFVVNWLAFVPSYLGRTERYYDLTGAITNVSVAALAFVLGARWDLRTILITLATIAWGLRLGWFLFGRIVRVGSDRRFDAIKLDPVRFAMAWTMQGLWVIATQAAGLAAVTGPERGPLWLVGVVGCVVWIAGFSIEVVADAQKSAFKRAPANEDRFIDSGLWRRSRHPNYFGEIVLWTGIAVVAWPVLSGWRLATLVSPLFVVVLLTRISGVPMLERRAEQRWGRDPAYREYAARTPLLVPYGPTGD